jgi:hypothetical protein
MKKTNLDNKLKLNTETLLPLQADALEGVNGGLSLPTTTTVLTRLTCISCIRPSLLTCGQGGQGGGQ